LLITFSNRPFQKKKHFQSERKRGGRITATDKILRTIFFPELLSFRSEEETNETTMDMYPIDTAEFYLKNKMKLDKSCRETQEFLLISQEKKANSGQLTRSE